MDNLTQQPWRDRLYLPAYRYAEAARFAQTWPSNIRRWYHGYQVPGHQMQPVFPFPPAGLLSYVQLVEVAFAATLRHYDLKLDQLRRAHRYLRDYTHVDYPFAELDLRIEGTSLLANVLSGPESHKFLAVADRGGQLVWIEAVTKRAEEFDYENGLALRWHPRGRDNIILIDPRIAFGAPVIGDTGIPTYVIRERYKAGEHIRDIKEDFGVSHQQIQQALAFEGILIPAA